MVSIQNIQFTYPNSKTLVFPNFICKAGETLLISGNSGTGKTTLLHILAGIQKADSGAVVIDKHNIQALSGDQMDAFRGKHIGLILQNSHFIEAFNVLENVVFASWLGQGKELREKAQHLLETLGLGDQLYKKMTALSIGQQQRVSIARALINDPAILLADEPTSSLDDENTQIVSDLLIEMATKFQTALIIVTHDSRLKEKFPNQIVLK
ncbi:MAG: ATP-binding cassette domain-containing protein [Flavobacterium sp.]|nr:ATP-binding cassette domain-containing protein [Candidatus Neoflavobacterium equi]